MKRIAFLVSGSGSNMQAVLDAIERGVIKGARACFVASSRAGVFALERAARRGIPCGAFEKSAYASFEERDAAITAAIRNSGGADLVVLAGYLGIITPAFVKEYAGRMINIHPSLLPKHGGKGFYGIKVHEAVLAAGDTESGCTVHYVADEIDGGEIILQGRVPVLAGDTPEALQKRVLEVEHGTLIEAIRICLNG